jgi:hypothetical protein
MKLKKLMFGLLVSLLTLALGHGAPARASVVEGTTTAPFGVFNLCNNEFVSAIVRLHFVMTPSTDGAHTVFMLEYHGTATGSLGNTYHISQSLPIGTTNTNGSQLETTAVTDLVVVSNGPAPNIRVHALIHLTIDANGNPTAQVNVGSSSCG